PLDFVRAPLRKHGIAARSKFHFAKGAFYDISSATHDRRHAGAESRPEHSNLVFATGVPVRTPLPQAAASLRPRGDPGLSGLPDQRKETLPEFRAHRHRRVAISV